MSSDVELSERLSFSFIEPVSALHVDLRLQCLSAQNMQASVDTITVTPEPSSKIDQVDTYGNRVLAVRFDRPISRLVVSAYHRLQDCCEKPLSSVYQDSDLVTEDGTAIPLDRTTAVAELRADVARVVDTVRSGWTVDAAITSLDRTLDEIDRSRRGVCQDMARLAVEILRRRGIPARFLVGYALPDPVPRVLRRHAWLAAHLGDRWEPVDVANLDDQPALRIASAWGSDLASIGPVIGRSPGLSVSHREIFAQARKPSRRQNDAGPGD